MNSRSRNSIDGFVSRRAPINQAGRLGVQGVPQASVRRRQITDASVASGSRRVGLSHVRGSEAAGESNSGQSVALSSQATSSAMASPGLSRVDIDNSLKDIDVDSGGGKGKKPRRKRLNVAKVTKRLLQVLLIVGVLVGLYVGVTALMASGKMFSGGFMGLVQKAPLKTDINGRSNILIFGTSDDSEGGDHPGAELSDSIMLVSLDQVKKEASMVSVPRDFWVELDNPCEVGYEAKINTVYMCGKGADGDDSLGADALRSKVGNILGFDIQYYAHVNYSVLSEVVNAIGGVEVTIESDDPRGVYDPNFDWMCNHQCNLVKYENGEVAQLNGERALALARARNAQGGYGLSGGNFDREKNQQKIIKAIQQKAVSAGTLADVGKVTSLIEALGDNLRSNFETKEVRTLIDLASEIGGDRLTSVPLDEEGSAVVKVGNYYGQSVVMPVDGMYDYSGIQTYLKGRVLAGGIAKEGKTVSVYNASGVPGLAQSVADQLEESGILVVSVGNAPDEYRGSNFFYGNIDGGEETKKVLERVGVAYDRDGVVTSILDDGSDIKVVIGSDLAESGQR